MGLNFNHCDASWSYGGFHHFRVRLASAIGVTLDEMVGFNWPSNEPGKDWSSIDDPLVPLLDHSDCDGVLTPDQCKQVAPRLQEIISDWDDGDYDKQMALELIKGMQQSFATKTPLEFI